MKIEMPRILTKLLGEGGGGSKSTLNLPTLLQLFDNIVYTAYTHTYKLTGRQNIGRSKNVKL